MIFVVVFGVAAYWAYDRRSIDLSYTFDRIRLHTRLISEKQDEIIRHTEKYLAVIIETQEAASPATGPRCHSVLEQLKTLDPRLSNILIAAVNGEVLCNATATPAPVNLADRGYFAKALAGTRAVIGTAVTDRSTGQWVLPFAQSFRNAAGDAAGVLVVSLDLNWIAAEFDRASLPPGSSFGVVDGTGTVLARRAGSEPEVGTDISGQPFFKTLLAQDSHSIFEADDNGGPRIYAASHVAQTVDGPIRLWIGLARNAVTAHADRQFATAIGLLVLLLTLAFAAAWYGGEHFLVRPLGAITRAARDLSRGNHKARSGLPHTDDEIGQLAKAFDEMAMALMSKSEILRLNRALRMLSGCNRVLVHAGTEPQLLHDICRTIVDTGGYRMAWVGFAEQDPDRSVRPAAMYGFDNGYLDNARISWADAERGRGPTGIAIRTGTTQINQNFATNEALTLWRAEALKRNFQSSSAFPLTADDRTFGALTIYSERPEPFGPDEVELLEELAADLSYGIHTQRLRDRDLQGIVRLERSMEAAVQAMATTLEMRDPYTAGHQRRVGQLAVAIARELNVPEDEIRAIHLAATVHDLGKIHIPAEILSKPTPLTEIEFRMLKRHPEVGYDILKGIDFPWPIADLIRQHHERADGSGYPLGLPGDEILLGARILAIADVVEAMASHRPYRPALGIDTALDEIRKNRGRLYDRAAADACLRLFTEKTFTFIN